jgi:hypothetical protein
MKTLKLLPTYSTQPIPQNTTSPTSNPPQNQLSPLEITKTQMALRKEKLLRQQKMTVAKDTGMQLTPLTKAQELAKVQELYLKQFRTYQWQWAAYSKESSDLAVAMHYQLHSAGMALYLFIIYPKLYKLATSLLCSLGKQYPNPLTSTHRCTATDPEFILRLQKALH